MKFYAVCNANGPISVCIQAFSLEQAVSFFASKSEEVKAEWVDYAKTDIEDNHTLGDCAHMTEDEFDNHLMAHGFTCVADLDSITAYDGRLRHLEGGWSLWV